MARLPEPGGDNGKWGQILNDYLSQSHNPDGTIKTGAITKSDIGLGQVDNTSDANKPISTATQTALSAKLATADLDTQAATKINDSASAMRAALSAQYSPKEGRLRHRPAATGSQRYYYATDDCGGTVYQDVAASQWKRIAPRGEILAVRVPASNFITSTSLTAVYGAFMELTTDSSPTIVEVQLEAEITIGDPNNDTAWTSGSRYCRLALTENGSGNIARDVIVQADSPNLSNLPRTVSASARRVLLPNTSYAWQLYISAQGSVTPVVRVRPYSVRMKVVEL